MAPLFDTSTLVTYGLATAALVAAPGPGRALVLTRSFHAAGLEIGTVVHTVAAALGLSAILATSATAFAVVRITGTVLTGLGIRLALQSRR